jgi:glycosyltransferase involved in cell wall biosynthesis
VPVSIALLAFQQADTVEAAARSCLAQLGGPYEVVLSDDASTDATFDVLQRLGQAYRGPHRVVVRRNAVNVGIGAHYNELLRACTGDLIVTAAGDDLSLPHRVSRLVQAWDANDRRADLIASHVIDLDHHGATHGVIRVDDLAQWSGIEHWLVERPYIIGAGHAFTRRMMERFGPFSEGIAYEDQIMAFRAIVSGGAVTVEEALVQYRRGGTSRLPTFEDWTAMRRWQRRQSARMLAEIEQLLADALLVGEYERVERKLHAEHVKQRYLVDMFDADDLRTRWHLFKDTRELPTPWRFRKVLHGTFPVASARVKNALLKWQR